MFKFVVTLAVLLLANSALAFWTPCPGLPGPTTVTSPLCTPTHCTAQRGSMLIAAATFTSPGVHPHLINRFSTTFLGIQIVIPNEPGFEDACWFLRGAACPTTAGVSINVVPNISFKIKITFPIGRIHLGFECANSH